MKLPTIARPHLLALAALLGVAPALAATRYGENLRALRGPEVCIGGGIVMSDDRFDGTLGDLFAGTLRLHARQLGLPIATVKQDDCAGFVTLVATNRTTPNGVVYSARLELTVQEASLKDLKTTYRKVVSPGADTVRYVGLWSSDETVGIVANRDALVKRLNEEANKMFAAFLEDWGALK